MPKTTASNPLETQSLLENEFREPYNSWMSDPNPENTGRLLKSIHPVLTAALRSYATLDNPTMYSRAKLMALDAMKRYDPSKAKLRTHLMFQLQGLRRQHAKGSQILSIPEQVSLDAIHLRDAENFLSDQLGRVPSDAELADHIGLSLKRIDYIRRLKPTMAEGSLTRRTEEGEDTFAPAVTHKPKVKQWHEFVYHDLSPVDQVILEHTLGLHKKPVLSNQDIAKKLKITPGAVSQRKARIQAKLDLREEFGVI